MKSRRGMRLRCLRSSSSTDTERYRAPALLPVLGPHDEAVAVLTCPCVNRIDRHLGPGIDTAREMLREVATALSCR